jgi:tetratricopeptide (TPR) repeat protein
MNEPRIRPFASNKTAVFGYTGGRHVTGLWTRHLALVILVTLSVSAGATSVREEAEDFCLKTNYQAAVDLLNKQTPKDAVTYALTGRCYYGLSEFKKATEALERAVAMDSTNSDYFLWLGRAYGRRAEASTFLTAPSHAIKARTNFERAVALDPRNLPALSDLFEYYLQAPGFLGGGFDKAATLAEKIRALDPVEYRSTQARLAEQRK